MSSNPDRHQAALYNVTDASNVVVGSSARITGGTAYQTNSVLDGEFTIAATKVLRLRHWTQTAQALTGLGEAVSSGAGEVYAELTLTKVA